MDYREFYMNEFFPRKRVKVSDRALRKWSKFDLTESKMAEKYNWREYHYDGDSVRVYVYKELNGKKSFTVSFELSDSRRITYVDELKLQIFTYVKNLIPRDVNLKNINDPDKREDYFYNMYLRYSKGL